MSFTSTGSGAGETPIIRLINAKYILSWCNSWKTLEVIMQYDNSYGTWQFMNSASSSISPQWFAYLLNCGSNITLVVVFTKVAPAFFKKHEMENMSWNECVLGITVYFSNFVLLSERFGYLNKSEKLNMKIQT